jgi:hypothetical protein
MDLTLFLNFVGNSVEIFLCVLKQLNDELSQKNSTYSQLTSLVLFMNDAELMENLAKAWIYFSFIETKEYWKESLLECLSLGLIIASKSVGTFYLSHNILYF